MNIFSMANKMVFVDVPGYGFGSKTEDMERLGFFFRQTRELAVALLLINSQHGIKDIDRFVVDLLEKQRPPVPFQVIELVRGCVCFYQ